MNILFLGDIVGRSGRQAVISNLSSLKKKYDIDFTVANAENAAHGKGMTGKIYSSLKAAGVDVITLGNHAFSKSEIIEKMNDCVDMIRPANMEPLQYGHSCIVKKCGNMTVGVINLMGSIFMNSVTEPPVPCMKQLLKTVHADCILVDLHAEATSEKQMFFQYFRNEVTAVIGTHTHVQTADEMIKDGCAFMCDAGMCGSYDSILGRDIDEVIHHNILNEATRFIPAEGPAVICGCVISIDDATHRATAIERIQMRPE